LNILGIDFEDWFHPELVQKYPTKNPRRPTVINGLDKILDWLRKSETYATFFVVGELLQFKPELMDKILDGGHEIGFHTMYHTRLDAPGFRDKFDEELKNFNALTGGRAKGFRAPTFSLNKQSAWAIDDLANNGYLYDSSVVPAKTSLYGLPDAVSKPYRISSSTLIKDDPQGKIMEYPLLVTKLFGKRIPAAGGFYVRILPAKVITNAINANEKTGMPACLYVHSWELTPEFMPKISMSFKDGFITYHNIEKTLSRMTEILKKFQFTSFSNYINKKN
jgi:polysaccharide deacetylase family protein (PEP-CTERM system associated)